MDFEFSYTLPIELLEMLPNLLSSMINSAVAIVIYILMSLGLMQIANRRGIRKGWLAWLPVGSSWILGSISDQYRYVVCGQVTNRRKTMVILEIVLYAILVPFLASTVWMIVASIATTGGGVANPTDEQILSAIGIPMLAMLFWTLVMVGISIPYTVIQFKALWDLYGSAKPKLRVLFLLLSIFLGISAFLVFICKDKDLGMPPRKQPTPPQPEIVVVEEPVETEIVEEPMEEGFANPEEFEEE